MNNNNQTLYVTLIRRYLGILLPALDNLGFFRLSFISVLYVYSRAVELLPGCDVGCCLLQRLTSPWHPSYPGIIGEFAT